jgi:hypothetical protein
MSGIQRLTGIKPAGMYWLQKGINTITQVPAPVMNAMVVYEFKIKILNYGN